MNTDEAILLAGKVIKENMEQKINKDNLVAMQFIVPIYNWIHSYYIWSA